MGAKLGSGAFATVHKCIEKVGGAFAWWSQSPCSRIASSLTNPLTHEPIPHKNQATKAPAAVKVFDLTTAAPMVRERIRSSVLEEVR